MKYMEFILEKIIMNRYFNFTIAILGIALAVYFYYKSKSKKVIYYKIQSYCSFRDIGPNINVTVENKIIDNLTITRCIIWNGGNVDLQENDFASSWLMTIRALKDCQILNASILPRRNNGLNKFDIDTSEINEVKINFDFMNIKDKIIIQLLHTGDPKNIDIIGNNKGGKKFSKKYNFLYDMKGDEIWKRFDTVS